MDFETIKEKALNQEMTRDEIQSVLQLRDRKSFRQSYIKPALEGLFIEMTIPNKPNSRMQRYHLTPKGIAFLERET